MIDSTEVKKIVAEAIAEQGAFLVDLSIGSDNQIKVLVDHMEGMPLKTIGSISRAIEGSLDRETLDFALEVSSPGVGSPLQVKEQYEKNIGRALKVVKKDGEVHKGDFIAFEDEVLTLSWKEREPKPVGKGKVTVTKEVKVALSDIKETIVEIKF